MNIMNGIIMFLCQKIRSMNRNFYSSYTHTDEKTSTNVENQLQKNSDTTELNINNPQTGFGINMLFDGNPLIRFSHIMTILTKKPTDDNFIVQNCDSIAKSSQFYSYLKNFFEKTKNSEYKDIYEFLNNFNKIIISKKNDIEESQQNFKFKKSHDGDVESTCSSSLTIEKKSGKVSQFSDKSIQNSIQKLESCSYLNDNMLDINDLSSFLLENKPRKHEKMLCSSEISKDYPKKAKFKSNHLASNLYDESTEYQFDSTSINDVSDQSSDVECSTSAINKKKIQSQLTCPSLRRMFLLKMHIQLTDDLIINNNDFTKEINYFLDDKFYDDFFINKVQDADMTLEVLQIFLFKRKEFIEIELEFQNESIIKQRTFWHNADFMKRTNFCPICPLNYNKCENNDAIEIESDIHALFRIISMRADELNTLTSDVKEMISSLQSNKSLTILFDPVFNNIRSSIYSQLNSISSKYQLFSFFSELKWYALDIELHKFIEKHISIKLRIFPEFKSLIFILHKKNVFRFMDRFKYFSITYFSLYLFNTLFDNFISNDQIQSLLNYESDLNNFLLKTIVFILRTICIENILVCLDIGRDTILRYFYLKLNIYDQEIKIQLKNQVKYNMLKKMYFNMEFVLAIDYIIDSKKFLNHFNDESDPKTDTNTNNILFCKEKYLMKYFNFSNFFITQQKILHQVNQ